jgi:hypothetical protein
LHVRVHDDAIPGTRISVCDPAWKEAARVRGTSINWWTGVNVGKLEVSAEMALSFIESCKDSGVSASATFF